MSYHWDPRKATSNLARHGVDFADAVGVFEDQWALTIKEQVVEGEQRLVTMGTYFLGRVLVVVYTLRGDAIRLLSARAAMRREKNP
jgi:uncharacterized DUF497 family protein